MKTTGLPGVSFGGVSRRDGWTAAGRSEYQMGIERHHGVPAAKWRNGDPVTHVKQWLMLPENVDKGYWTREAVWTAAARAETRQDAREGRFFDISWPRDLPTNLIEPCVTALYAPLIDMGLAVQLDWETSPAEDGLPNDHIHGLISTRVLSNAGFSARKCRELDAWFRSNIRRHVVACFNTMAETHDLDVRFDARANAEREETLPPEDFLPRGIARNRSSPGAHQMWERRDLQRRLRREHDAIGLCVEKLREDRRTLLAELDAISSNMEVLTSWQHDGKDIKPLGVEIAITALLGRGIAVDRNISVPNFGLVLAIGQSVVIDQGNRILIEEPLRDDEVRVLHALARCKGWRDLSLANASGMPAPVPPNPEHVERQGTVRSDRGFRTDRWSKPSVIQAANEVMHNLSTVAPKEKQAMLDRVVAWGNPRLIRLVARLVAYVDGQPFRPVEAGTVMEMIDEAMTGDADLWKGYMLEQDLVAMTVPGNALSRPFRPHPRFYEYYGLSGGAALASVGGQDGAVQ